MSSASHVVREAASVFHGDLPATLTNAFRQATFLACDIETTGLDWRVDRPLLLQMYSPTVGATLIRLNGYAPNAIALLRDRTVCKVFHHAIFDLRFLTSYWKVRAANIACTKIAAKLLSPGDAEAQRLQALVGRFLGVIIDKTQQKSDWSAPEYSPAQIEYAVNDVQHLPSLYQAMKQALASAGLLELAERCYAHIPTRVDLELRGFGDVYTY
jgi:ribonuclease D